MEAEARDPLYGRPWKSVARFNTFEEADKARKKYLTERDRQAKVKKLRAGYVVKVRSTVVEAHRNKSKRKNKNFYKKAGVRNDS
tara:strand:+ start:4134 stop:4385 length:252 start_codon:yes stop_codon:yes gene_type:complete